MGVGELQGGGVDAPPLCPPKNGEWFFYIFPTVVKKKKSSNLGAMKMAQNSNISGHPSVYRNPVTLAHFAYMFQAVRMLQWQGSGPQEAPRS